MLHTWDDDAVNSSTFKHLQNYLTENAFDPTYLI